MAVQLDAVLRLVGVQVNQQVFRTVSRAAAGINVQLKQTVRTSTQLNRGMQNVQRTTKQTAQNVGLMSRAARTFLQRMAQFAVLLPTFATLNRAIQGGAKFLVEFESQLLKIVRIDIAGLSDRYSELADNIFRIGINMGASVEEVADSVRVFKQAGFQIEDSFDKAETSALAAVTTTLQLAQAQELLIQVSKQFGDEAVTAAQAVDILAKVEDSAAVNAQDVAEAFKAGGNALATFAKSFEDSVGIISALSEQTRKSGREIGTFLKTLQTRIFAAGDARDAVEGLGVAVENLDGTLRPTLNVLNDLGAAFDQLTEAQAASAAKSIAGVRQFESLQATLVSLKRANELSAKAADAQGTAEEKLAIVQQGLGFQITQTVNEFKRLAVVVGDAGVTEFFRDTVKVARELAGVIEVIVGGANKLGVALAPLALVGAIGAGKRVFGAGKGGGGGQQQATAQVIQLGNAARGASAGLGTLTGATAKQTQMTNFAVRSNKVAATSMFRVAGKTALVIGAMAAVSVATKTLEGVFEDTSSTAGRVGSQLTETGGNALQMGLSFGLISGKAGLMAGAITFMIQNLTDLSAALKENKKANEEIAENKRFGDAFETFRKQILEGGDALDSVSNAFARNVDAAGDLDVNAFIKTLTENIRSTVDFAGLSEKQLESIAQSVFSGGLLPSAAKQIAADQLGGEDAAQRFLDDFNKELKDADIEVDGITKAQFVLRNLFSSLPGDIIRPLSKMETQINAVNNRLNSLDFQRNITNPLLALREQSARLNADLASLTSELGNVDIGFEKTLKEKLGDLQVNSQLAAQGVAFAMGNLGTALKEAGGGEAASVLSDTIRGIIDTAGPGIIQGVKEIEDQIRPEVLSLTQFTSTQIRAIISAQTKLSEAERTSKEVDLKEAQLRASSRIELAKQESDAARDAFEATIELNDQLIRLGGTVGGTLAKDLENFDVSKIQGILDGTIKATDEITRFVQILSGDEVTKATAQLNVSMDASQSAISAYKNRLEELNKTIGEAQSGGRRSAGGVALKDALEERNDLEQKIADAERARGQERIQLNSKLIEAQIKQQARLAKEEEKRIQLLGELTNSQKEFAGTLKESRMELDRFVADQESALLGKQADASSELKSAQQEVLSSTESLSDAYFDFKRAILDFNGAVAQGRIESNLLGREIGVLTGDISTFKGRFDSLGNAFTSVLNDSNISLQKRIELERQLATETISFLEQARGEIIGAGLTIFGQTGEENQALATGITGLEMIVDRLGGSFESFLGLSDSAVNNIGNELLNLPIELRRQMLDALSLLPGTANIGGFSVEQLETAIGQLGAGAAGGVGLPSIEALTEQQVAQLERLQSLAAKDASLQVSQLFAARENLDAAKEAVDAAEIAEERARENLAAVEMAVREEHDILLASQSLQSELTDRLISANSQTALDQLTREAELFREQNTEFRTIGDNIVNAIRGVASARGNVLTAESAINGARGYIPNFAGGNLSQQEIVGLLNAASREKRQMPGGAGLAVANDTEMIIPTRNKGFIPNFVGGSDIAAGIEGVKGVNEAVVAAISRSVTEALTDIDGGGAQAELIERTNDLLDSLKTGIEELNETNTSIATNTQATADATGTGTGGNTQGQQVTIELNTNQQNSVSVTGLENLRDELETALTDTVSDQIASQVSAIMDQIDSVLDVLRANDQISGLGQAL